MKICIIGWYGTETIGDRAILAGMLALLSDVFPDFEVSLGSLNPFFSERTLREDQPLWDRLASRTVPVRIFDSTRPAALKKEVGRSDLLLVGGGPLMDLREMHMLDFAFQYARRRKIRSGVFGCGIGPLTMSAYKKAAGRILSAADFVILRDSLSVDEARNLTEVSTPDIAAAIDPAACCALRYDETAEEHDLSDRILINMRDLSFGYGKDGAGDSFFNTAAQIVRAAADCNPDFSIWLLPHHYFAAGGDDRIFLNQIKYRLSDREIRVQNEPLSLSETMRIIRSSPLNIGMRFHFILLSGLLNGRCRIINYTGADKGKIAGFLKDYDPQAFFNERRMLVPDPDKPDGDGLDVTVSPERFSPDRAAITAALDTCRSLLSKHLCQQ